MRMVILLFPLALACHKAPPPEPPPPAPTSESPAPASAPAVDCCTCQMWGVRGIEPGPDWEPPPLPEGCKEVLIDEVCAAQACPVPM